MVNSNLFPRPSACSLTKPKNSQIGTWERDCVKGYLSICVYHSNQIVLLKKEQTSITLTTSSEDLNLYNFTHLVASLCATAIEYKNVLKEPVSIELGAPKRK